MEGAALGNEIPELAWMAALAADGKYTAAAELCARASAGRDLPVALLVEWEEVAFRIRTGRLETARPEVLPLRAALERALALATTAAERARLEACIARQRAWHEPAASRVAAERAVSLARETNDPRALMVALYALHIALEDPGLISDRLAVSEELAALCDASFDPAVRATGHWRRLIDCLIAGDSVGFDYRLHALERASAESGDAYVALTAAMSRATAELMRGNYAEAQQQLPAMQAGYQQHSGLLTAAIIAISALPTYERGRRGSGTSLTSTVSKARRLPAFRVAMAYMLATSGRLPEARLELDEIDLTTLPRDSSLLPSLAMLIELAGHLGDPGLAHNVAARLGPYSGLVAVTGDAQSCWGPVDLYLGLAAQAQQDHETAALYFRRARKLASSFGMRPALARSLLGLAATAVGPEDPAALRQQALEIAERIGHAGVAAEARAALRAPAPPRPRAASTELTPREREVLALTAGGLTAAEVAARLVLSPRTVEKHLERAYSKIGARNRAEGVSWAITNGLIAQSAEM